MTLESPVNSVPFFHAHFRFLLPHGVVGCWLLGFIGGCADTEIRPQGDADGARSAVTSALDAWKDGKTAEQLRNADPAVYVSDEDWKAGRKLASYEVLREPEQNGSHWRTYVKLSFTGDASGSVKTVCYAVTPGSPASIIRSDFLN